MVDSVVHDEPVSVEATKVRLGSFWSGVKRRLEYIADAKLKRSFVEVGSVSAVINWVLANQSGQHLNGKLKRQGRVTTATKAKPSI